MFKYRAYGLCIESYIELPGYVEARADAPTNVAIRKACLAKPETSPKREFTAKLGAEEYSFYWDWIGTIAVRCGREILIDALPDADDSAVRLALPGVIFGALLHQRGVRVLHASCVAINGGAVAFVGRKRAGKSTMSAALHHRGHRLVTDDTLAVEFHDRDPVVIPGIPRMHLWPDALDSLLDDGTNVPVLHPGSVKRGLIAKDGFSTERLPLLSIYVLASGDQISIEPLNKRDALIALLEHTWASRFMDENPAMGGHLLNALGPIVSSVPIRRLVRKRALSELHKVAEAVERDVSPVSGSS